MRTRMCAEPCVFYTDQLQTLSLSTIITIALRHLLRLPQLLEQGALPHGVKLAVVHIADGEDTALLTALGPILQEALHDVLAPALLLLEILEARQPVRVVAVDSVGLDRADGLQDVAVRGGAYGEARVVRVAARGARRGRRQLLDVLVLAQHELRAHIFREDEDVLWATQLELQLKTIYSTVVLLF